MLSLELIPTRKPPFNILTRKKSYAVNTHHILQLRLVLVFHVFCRLQLLDNIFLTELDTRITWGHGENKEEKVAVLSI